MKMDFEKLAYLLFPNINKEPSDYESIYPERVLSDGARVTRMAPSPTGYLHLGTLFASLVSERAAHQSGGVFFLRIEDTDSKREVKGGIKSITEGLLNYGILFDEGMTGENTEKGAYGPYIQSKRVDIYQCFAKELVKRGLAYPCFCSEERLSEMREEQERKKDLPGYWGEYARCRNLTYEEIENKILVGERFVTRLRSPGKPGGRIAFLDGIKGDIEMDENITDIVLLKSDGIPTYHFAHAVDDHLMRTTDVTRGDEWISSVPIHLQLFSILGFKAPKYSHIAPIMKIDNGGKRKLSKRRLNGGCTAAEVVARCDALLGKEAR
jgi:glutamyl-tRNA synthetase